MLTVAQDRDPYVLLLIDGDGMIFEDKLIDQGEVGGREAAGHLWNAITDHIHQNIPDLGSDYRIVTRIYANLKGLGEVCNKAGILSRPSLMDEFARGFTGSKQLFDFVDVGMGKDRADDKISGTIGSLFPPKLIAVDVLKNYSNSTFMTPIVDMSSLDAPTIMVMPAS